MYYTAAIKVEKFNNIGSKYLATGGITSIGFGLLAFHIRLKQFEGVLSALRMIDGEGYLKNLRAILNLNGDHEEYIYFELSKVCSLVTDKKLQLAIASTGFPLHILEEMLDIYADQRCNYLSGKSSLSLFDSTPHIEFTPSQQSPRVIFPVVRRRNSSISSPDIEARNANTSKKRASMTLEDRVSPLTLDPKTVLPPRIPEQKTTEHNSLDLKLEVYYLLATCLIYSFYIYQCIDSKDCKRMFAINPFISILANMNVCTKELDILKHLLIDDYDYDDGIGMEGGLFILMELARGPFFYFALQAKIGEHLEPYLSDEGPDIQKFILLLAAYATLVAISYAYSAAAKKLLANRPLLFSYDSDSSDDGYAMDHLRRSKSESFDEEGGLTYPSPGLVL